MSHGAGRVSPEDLEIIRESYAKCIGKMTAPVAGMIESKLDAGMSPSVILHAITETGFAPRPSPYYLRAILTRYHSAGILTEEDLMNDCFRREGEQRRANNERWDKWYGTDEDLW